MPRDPLVCADCADGAPADDSPFDLSPEGRRSAGINAREDDLECPVCDRWVWGSSSDIRENLGIHMMLHHRTEVEAKQRSGARWPLVRRGDAA